MPQVQVLSPRPQDVSWYVFEWINNKKPAVSKVNKLGGCALYKTIYIFFAVFIFAGAVFVNRLVFCFWLPIDFFGGFYCFYINFIKQFFAILINYVLDDVLSGFV